MGDVSGVAVLGGEYDLMVCVAQPWEVASGVILEQIHGLPGVVSTDTLVSICTRNPRRTATSSRRGPRARVRQGAFGGSTTETGSAAPPPAGRTAPSPR